MSVKQENIIWTIRMAAPASGRSARPRSAWAEEEERGERPYRDLPGGDVVSQLSITGVSLVCNPGQSVNTGRRR